MCSRLGLQVHVVSKEQYNAVLCQRFHYYLNRVDKIQPADQPSVSHWFLDMLVATYAWNAAPIDGTNLIKSFAAKDQRLHFPLQAQAILHLIMCHEHKDAKDSHSHWSESMILWAKQPTILRMLIEDRRIYHQVSLNQPQGQLSFEIGDVVIIRRQTQPKSNKDTSSKPQVAKYKGPYQVLERSGKTCYKVQKMLTFQGRSKHRALKKYLATALRKIPSTMLIHKWGEENRLTRLEQPPTRNPGEHALRVHRDGEYVQAPTTAGLVIDSIEDLWSLTLDSDSENDEESTGTHEVTGRMDSESQKVANTRPESETDSPICKTTSDTTNLMTT